MGSYQQASCPITLKCSNKTLFSTNFILKMMSFKTLITCCIVAYTQASKPDVLAKRDSSVEVDPYAAYYEQYTNAVHTQGLTEKQGFAHTMENVFGDDAALVLGTIGALMGTLAAIGVVLNNNNINELSKDQDSICTTAKQLGGFTCSRAGADPTLAELRVCMDTLVGYTTPDC